MKKIFFYTIFPILLIAATNYFIVPSCFSEMTSSASYKEIENFISQTKKKMRPLDLSNIPVYSDSTHACFKYYGIDFTDIDHYFGFFNSKGRILAGHIFKPTDSKGTVLEFPPKNEQFRLT